MQGRVLVIAGSDSGGGAGIQADIKTITALGAFAATAITALTAQNTLGVHGVMPVPPDFIRQQIDVVMRDIGADVIKIGMLGDIATIETVCDALAALAPDVPVVLDPVMVAKGGQALLAAEAVDSLRRHLLPRAAVITPNLPEAEALTGLTIRTEAEMRVAAAAILAMGVPAVLLKGGHLRVRYGDRSAGDAEWHRGVRGAADRDASYARDRMHDGIRGGSGVGAGSGLAGCGDPSTRLRAGRDRAAPGFGHGHGPLDHAVTVDLERLAR